MKYSVLCYPCCNTYYDSERDTEFLRVFDGGEYKIMSQNEIYQPVIKEILTEKLNLTPDWRLGPRSVCEREDLEARGLKYDYKNGKYEKA